MAEHGGYRKPSNPAPVSGPGALSARTDGGATSQPPMVASGGEYGARQEMEGIQSGAPLEGGGGEQPAPSAADLIPFGAPSQNAAEPITAGAAVGAGVGPQAAGIHSDADITLDQLKPFVRSLEAAANLPSATAETRAFVRALKAKQAGR